MGFLVRITSLFFTAIDFFPSFAIDANVYFVCLFISYDTMTKMKKQKFYDIFATNHKISTAVHTSRTTLTFYLPFI